MSEIEKKYSDYQISECDTQDVAVPVDERLCPTCQIDPDWKLPSAHWSMIQEAYLNKSVCEYHVRVYDSEVKILNKTPQASSADIIDLAVERVLVDFDKPLNDGTRQQLTNAAFIVDDYRNVESRELGMAFLVGVPAFNMDQIEANDSENSEESDVEKGNGGEIIIDVDGLGRRLRQLRLSIGTYGKYYALLNKSGGFVIRQEDNETQRVNYKDVKSKVKQFQNELSNRLAKKKYPKIGKPGFFKSKSAKRIKFTFKDNGKPFDLKTIHVLDSDCDKYLKIPVPRNSILRKPSMRIVYSFMENLQNMINDVTAKETKPWLDFTLEYFYPKYIVDYGSVGEIEDTKAGLECLLEVELGIGNGRVVDSLTAEIMSAFDTIEEELAKQACRSLTELSSGGATSLADKNKDLGKTPKEERELAMIARYQKEFENKTLDQMVKQLNDFKDVFEMEQSTASYTTQEIDASPPANKKNVFQKMKEYGMQFMRIAPPTYFFKNAAGEKIEQNVNIEVYIYAQDDIDRNSKAFAIDKFNNLEKGSFGNQIQNSPHFEEAMDAADEVLTKFENTYIQPVKDAYNGRSEFELVDLIPIIGLCGMSKLAGKAMECLANGVSFDDFLDMLIDKTFDFMELNTLSLFLNGLPADFRQDLSDTMEEQFGAGVDVSTLLGIKLAEGGGQKMSDFVKSKQVAKRVLKLFEKYEEPLSQATTEEKNFLKSQLGTNTFGLNPYDQIAYEMLSHYDRKSKTYIDGPITRKIADKEKEYKKREKFVLKFIKNKIRTYKKSQNSFRQAMQRVKSSVSSVASDIVDSVTDIASERKEIKSAISNLDEKIEAERSNIDKILAPTTFNADGTISDFAMNRSTKLELMKKIAERVTDYKSVKAGLETELDGFVANRTKEEASELKNRLDFLIDQGLQDVTQDLSETLRTFENLYKEASSAVVTAARNQIVTQGDIDDTPPGELNQFELAAKSFEETALGVKVDVVFDVIFDFIIDSILDYFRLDELFEYLRSYPVVDFALDKIESLILNPCPTAPIMYPPPNDFMKSLSIDICDPTVSLTFPKLIVPNINFRFKIEYQFNELFREAIIKLASDIALKMLTKFVSTLESALCNLVEAAGGIIASGLSGDLKGSFYRALNEAFCNDGEDPATSRAKAEQLADALFSPAFFDANGNYEGVGKKVSNVISSVATTEEFLHSMVARDGEENDQFNTRISNAVSALTPEMEVLLGDPNQVAFFFRSLGSFLSPDERRRIRDMLEAGVPNLPISKAICLTNDQLDEWNRLREDMLRGMGVDPYDRVKKLNDATLAALGDAMDDVAVLASDGPFIGAATNEAMKDVCDPNNIFNSKSESAVDKTQSDELIDGFFDNISRSLTRGFLGRGGILGEATRDVEDRRELGRSVQKLFRLNYGNSQDEQDLKFNEAGRIKKFIMNLGEDDNGDNIPDVIGRYPDTVAIKQRKEILSSEGVVFNFDRVKNSKASSRNVVYRYMDVQDNFSYIQKVAVSNLRRPKKTFGYNLQVIENIDDEGPQVEINLNTVVPISNGESSYLESLGFQYKSNTKDDIRKESFNKIMNSKITIKKDFENLYEEVFRLSNKNIVKSLLTNETIPNGTPTGYLYGYTSDDLTKQSFEYTPSSNEDELGTFASPRIIPLDPKIYGGRYSNPPYYVEPRRFTGWLELATTAFESQEGCDPKTPPLISFMDIKNRTKNLSSSIKNDPRLTKSPDCVNLKPFKLLLGSKNKAKLDGVIRTTIRAYVAEFYVKGYGLFSNLQIRPENFDSSMMTYIVKKMKSEMQDLGTRTSNRKVRIVRERYWYTFLEQCVEAYQRTVDIDNVKPPEPIMEALNKIQLGLDQYRPLDAQTKKRLRKNVGDMTLKRPSGDFDPLKELSKGPLYNLAMAMAFRLTPEDEKDSFFNGQLETGITGTKVRYASIKKLKFFQSIYFIKLFEKESILIMSELIKDELSRMSQLVVDGPTDKPYYFDLYKSFFGMKSFFGDRSSSRVGLSSYYLEKQAGGSKPGAIPTVMSDNLTTPVPPSDEPQFILESYVRLVEKNVDVPNPFTNREAKYRGVVSLDDMSKFVEQNLDFLEDKYLSDFFGDLSFSYEGSFSSLMKKGFSSQQNINRLIELNKDLPKTQIVAAYASHIGLRPYEDFNVSYDQTFLLDGETPDPKSTIGSTGVKYGMRVSLVLPKSTFTPSELSSMKNSMSEISRREKSYIFEDGGFSMPLVSSEVDVIDCKFEDFDPLSGIETYDLECLINKMVAKPEFTMMFDKILNFRQSSSMLSIYCMETLPASIGRDESERTDINGNPDVEDWDRTINKFGKNFLRREFKSLYLSNTEDGMSNDDDDDESLSNLIKLNNPFDFLTMPSVRLPWWLKRRMKTKVYDANGQECASPEKDLQ